MAVRRMPLIALALALVFCSARAAVAQEPGKTGDDALDSLIEKLADPVTEKPAAKRPSPRAGNAPDNAKPEGSTAETGKAADAGTGAAAEKPSARQVPDGKGSGSGKPSAGEVSSKDKDLDALLEKLGETTDRPTPEEREARPRAGAAAEPSRPDSGGSGEQGKPKAKGQALEGRDKEIDERLAEFAGKKRKKKSPDEESGGPMGQIIKEMREVEQKLGKPETGEDTQAKQKRIVKQIDTMIEQVRQSGSSGSKGMRMVRQQGQKPGNQRGQEPGANAGGAPATKPARPTDRHALAGGKDIWGHLPAELRQELENSFKELPLPSKEKLISDYYNSVAKQKLVRGD